ncbi:MAG: efflux RND transporter periplasmic adaptor subunit [Deltaproteobacteria bacterium]|nr:efflux RND transporter periplasmic adaptor subunit [Deltaproteobacteria bacterium]
MNDRSHKTIRIFSLIAGVFVLGFLILLVGGFLGSHKIPSNQVSIPAERESVSSQSVQASVKRVTEFYEAVGTVRPRFEINVEAQVTGRIQDIFVRPGDKVGKGQLLVVLDGQELQARLDQNKASLAAAQASLTQAESEFERIKTYFEAEAATLRDLELTESSYLNAKAAVERATKLVVQSEIARGYTRIAASEDGEVVKRLVEPGDVAWPGKPLIILQTRGALRLEALVREGLINLVSAGMPLTVVVGAIDARLRGTVEEVVPSADPTTRTFLVKVGLPLHEGLYPGMFGRLMIPIEERTVVVVPQDAVIRIGQLEEVMLRENGLWQRIFVMTGQAFDDGTVEILSGLNGGETLALKGGGDA